MKSQVKRHYELFSEAQLQDEAQLLEKEQAEAVKLLETSHKKRDLLKEYQQLYPGIKGGIGIEEIQSDIVGSVATVAMAAHKAKAATLEQQVVLLETKPQASLSPSPAITNIFRDASIYDSTESRWIVRGIVEEAGEKRIHIEAYNGELKSISEDQLNPKRCSRPAAGLEDPHRPTT